MGYRILRSSGTRPIRSATSQPEPKKVHHIAFGPQGLIALDYNEIVALLFEQRGERQPGDAGA